MYCAACFPDAEYSVNLSDTRLSILNLQAPIVQKRPFFKHTKKAVVSPTLTGIYQTKFPRCHPLLLKWPATNTYYKMDRHTRVRFSPFGSEYDSSSSEYDPRDRGTTPALSDYSPQISSRSRANSTRSSPAPPSFSPDLGSSASSAPTSNPSYSHLVATFAAPKRRKSRRKLGPDERREVHQLRKMGACTRCWGLKMKACNLLLASSSPWF